MTFSDSDGIVDWPTLSELKQTLDVAGSEWDLTLTRQLAAAIEQVKGDVGLWDELVDVPDESLAHAAMRLAVLMRTNAQTPPALLTDDAVYQRCLRGHRRRFAIA